MKKEPSQIAKQILTLVNELVEMTGNSATNLQASNKEVKKGAVGALELLIEEGFLNSPQGLVMVIEKLKELGRHYPKSTISMGLLNLTRSRILVRIRNVKTKNWEYVIRK